MIASTGDLSNFCMKSRVFFGLGVVLILAGLLSNQWVLARLLVADQTFKSASLKVRIVLFEAFLISLGGLCIRFRQTLRLFQPGSLTFLVGSGCLLTGIFWHEWLVIAWWVRESIFIKIGVWLIDGLLIALGIFLLSTHHDRLAANISLLCVTCLGCLIVLEGALQWLSPPIITGVGTDQTPNARLYGWALPPNTRLACIHPDTGTVSFFRTNSQGWKDVEHTFEKPAQTFRILFLGDSNTYGIVPLQDLYTRQVEQLLRQQGFPHVEVISMGVGGWGTDQALEALLHEGIRYMPDLVIYQFCGNDLTDNLPPLNPNDPHALNLKKPFQYHLTTQGLVRIPQKIPLPTRTLRSTLHHLAGRSALIYHLNRARHHLFSLLYPSENEEISWWWDAYPLDPTFPYFLYHAGPETPEMQAAWELFEALIVEMKTVTEQHGTRFVIFSEESDLGKRAWYVEWQKIQTDAAGDSVLWQGTYYPIDWQYPLKKLTEICQRQNIWLIPPVRSYARYRYDPHPNAEGNLNMARDIVTFLGKHGFIPKEP